MTILLRKQLPVTGRVPASEVHVYRAITSLRPDIKQPGIHLFERVGEQGYSIESFVDFGAEGNDFEVSTCMHAFTFTTTTMSANV